MNRILTCLLLVAVSAKGDSSSPYEYEQSYNSAWHAPAAISPKSSLLHNIFSLGGLRERQAGGLSTSLLMAAAGTGVSLAATAATSASLTDDINKVSERTDKAALVAAKTCAQMRTLLGIADPTIRTDTGLATAGDVQVTTNAGNPAIVSTNLGSKTASSYQLTGCVVGFVTGSPTITVPTANLNGLSFAGANCALTPGAGGAATIDDSAVSIADFNIFRLRMVDAINALDQKLRDALATTQPTC